MDSNERRAEPRTDAQSVAYLMWDDHSGPREARARLVDVSAGGMRLVTNAKLAPGTILYCASPTQEICTRAMVCHSTRSLLYTTAASGFSPLSKLRRVIT